MQLVIRIVVGIIRGTKLVLAIINISERYG